MYRQHKLTQAACTQKMCCGVIDPVKPANLKTSLQNESSSGQLQDQEPTSSNPYTIVQREPNDQTRDTYAAKKKHQTSQIIKCVHHVKLDCFTTVPFVSPWLCDMPETHTMHTYHTNHEQPRTTLSDEMPTPSPTRTKHESPFQFPVLLFPSADTRPAFYLR